ncbi:unnamed protein product [Brassica oleracea var. botrytis]
MANSYTLLASLMAGRCSNTAEVHLLRFWEAWNKKGGELMMSTCSSLMSNQSAYQVRGHNPFRFHKKEAAEESTGNTVEKLQGAKNGGFFIKVESMCVCVDICYLEAELLLPDVEWMSRTNIPNEYMYRDIYLED